MKKQWLGNPFNSSKKVFFLILTIVIPYWSRAQAAHSVIRKKYEHVPQIQKSRANALATWAYKEIDAHSNAFFLQQYYGIDPSNTEALIGGLLKSNGTFVDSLQSLCYSFVPVSNGIYTFQVKLKNYKKLFNSPQVGYLSLSRKADIQLFNSRKDAGVDKVHLGVDLPSPFTGKGVLAGLVDVGIEYTNPSFRTTNGDSIRIIKAWAQNRQVGIKPSLFNYGVEFAGKEQIALAGHDSVFGTHGTVVMAGMAGSGYGSGGKYAGIAPDAEIIAISADRMENSLMDGILYFNRETKTHNKRGVFNLSWGSQLGPHDGTSLFDHAIDSLTERGLIIVGAVGNWGDDSIHIKSVSGSTNLMISTMVKNADPNNYALVDIWGKPYTHFSVCINAVDIETGSITKSSNFFSTQTQGDFQTEFILNGDTSKIYLFNTARDGQNNRPNSFVAMTHDVKETKHYLSISISSRNNEIHAWAAQNASFSNKLDAAREVLDFKPGDSQYSVAEIGGTAKTIITVGSHVAQSKYRCILGYDRFFSADSGKIGPFSSLGPTQDGRTKPDLTSPGSLIAPANGFEPNFTPSGKENYLIEEGSEFKENNRAWYWIQDEATSFAAPLVTGSVAVLLQVNPTLTAKEARDLLRSTTTKDDFTGSINSNGSNQWGWGKLNLYKAVSSALSVVTGIASQDASSEKTFWSTNPTKDLMVVFLQGETSQKPSLDVYDLTGKMVYKALLERTEGFFFTFDLRNLPVGQYVGRFASDSHSKSLKITKVE